MKISNPLIIILISITSFGALTACKDPSGGFSDILDSGTGSTETECKIGSKVPNATSFKIKANGGSQSFVVGGVDSKCNISWKLNGTSLSGSDVTQSLSSSQLTSGTNLLSVTVSSGTSSDTYTWTLSKNTAPSCISKNPLNNPPAFAYNTPQSLFGVGSDADGDTLSNFVWKYDDTEAPSLFSSVSSTTLTGSAVFTSLSAGSHKVALSFSDGYDTGECSWTMNMSGGCSISSSSPSGTTTKMPYSAGNQSFAVNINSNSCIPRWTLNAAPLSGSNTTQNISSSQLAMASNILTVSVSDGVSTDTKSWTITRNTPPSCSSKTPSSNPTTFAWGSSQSFAANAVDADGDTLSGYTWKFNDSANPGLFSGVASGSGTTSATFTAGAAQVGNSQKVSAVFYDGYDYGECFWTMPITTQCSIISAYPSTSTFKMAQSGTNSQDFTVVPNDSGCSVTWSLGGNNLSGTNVIKSITSSQLSPGASTSNTLIATVSNGTSAITKTWNLIRNQLPNCGSKTPSTNPAAFVFTNHTKTFSASANDPDGDTMTSFAWKFNDNATPSSIFNNVNSNGNSSTMVFYPTVSQVGTGQKLSLTFSDGYDSGECYWNFDLANACTITSSAPSTSTYKVSNSDSAAQNYVVVPSDSACTVAWTLNGSPLVGSNSIQSIAGSALNLGGNNLLSVQVSNGVSTDSRTWNVTRNQVPTCSNKTPAANPSNFAYNVQTNAFSGTASDPDGDSLSQFIWKFNGNASPSSIYGSPTPGAPTTSQSMTFKPTSTQVGSSQKLALTFSDGYDSGECYWNFGITDPNVVSLVSCNPTTNPIIVTTTGTTSSKDLQINALNASSYAWTRQGSTISGATSSLFSVSQASGSAGNYTYVATASDVLGSSPVSCSFNVKINGLPTVTSATPAAAPYENQNWKLSWGSSMNFAVNATDPNGDSLFYTWKLDGIVQNTYLTGNTSTATFNPSYTQSLVDANNPHTISVEINDGSETVTRSWIVEVNKFSLECNNLYNGTVSAQGGKICTLIGVPGIGGGVNPTADQTLVRLRTSKVVDDGNGNWWILDYLNNVVSFYNRGTTAIGSINSPFFGIPGIPAGTVATIIGNGSAGSTADNNFNNSAKIDTGGNWGGITYDSSGPFIYVADWNNHRVLRIDGRSGSSNGKVTTVLGATPSGGTPANNTAGNTDGSAGTTHNCQNPADVHIATTSGTKYLYVSCYNSHTVKKMVADISSGSYGSTYTVVGRLAGGASSCGPENGTIGASGDSRTCYPWALSSDSDGNVYYTEGSNNTTAGGSRVRMINFSGSTVSLFGGSTSPSNASTYGATDTSATPLTAITAAHTPLELMASSANKATMWGNTPNLTSACVEMRIQMWNGTSPSTLSGNTAFTLANNTTGSDIYSDSACTLQTGIGGTQASRTFTLSTGISEAVLYFKNTNAGASTSTLTLSSALATNTGVSVVTNAVNAGGVNSKLAVVRAATFDSDSCQKIFVQIQNASGGLSSNSFGSTRVVRMHHNGVGTYYSDAACSTPAYNVSITNGSTFGIVYYRSKADIAANQVHTILGTGTAIAAYPNSTYPTAPTIANGGLSTWGMTAFNQPRGFSVHVINNAVKGFFVNSYNYHRMIYVNNDSSSRLIGSSSSTFSTPGYQASVVAGTGTAAYNSDGLGVASRMYNPISASVTANGNGVIISDSLNSRVRVLDISGTGDAPYQLTTYMGVGRVRSGNLGDTPVAATNMYLNYPRSMTIDSNNKLYIVDSSNGRIRRTNLLTGEVDTLIGNGVGAGATDGIDPTTAQMNSPRGLTMVTRGSTNFLVYSDTQGSAANQNCQLRALNMTSSNTSSTSTNFYTGALSIGPSKLSTVAGDYGLGCGTLGSISSPTNTRLNNPEGIANDGNGNLLVANYNDHCILKIAADSTVSVLVGNAGACTTTAGTVSDGSDTTNAVIKFPMAVVADPRFTAYGNFFFADDPTGNQSRIRYVNYSPSTVKVGSVTVPGATAPNGVVTTIWNIAPSPASAGYINSLIANKTSDGITHVCYSAGRLDVGQTGAHNIQCYDVGNGTVANLGTPDLRVGPDHTSGSSVRGGTTIDRSQEGIAASSAFLYSPYGLAFDSIGNLYVTETSSHQVRMVRRWW